MDVVYSAGDSIGARCVGARRRFAWQEMGKPKMIQNSPLESLSSVSDAIRTKFEKRDRPVSIAETNAVGGELDISFPGNRATGGLYEQKANHSGGSVGRMGSFSS